MESRLLKGWIPKISTRFFNINTLLTENVSFGIELNSGPIFKANILRKGLFICSQLENKGNSNFSVALGLLNICTSGKRRGRLIFSTTPHMTFQEIRGISY